MILVTGATGFLGAEVANQLAGQGLHIRCTRRHNSVIPPQLHKYEKLIEWVEADLLDISALEDAFENITHVYNCAAFVSLRQVDKKEMIYSNVTGTANVVNLCLANNCRLVHVSSVAAVGQAKPGQLTSEKDQLDQALETDGYAISKLESEMEVWRGIAEGLSAVIVNPSIIIGPSAGTTGSGALFKVVKNGLKFYTAGGMGFVDVEDVATCMIKLMAANISDERYIVSAENISYKEITQRIANHFGVKPPSIAANSWMMELAWRAAAFIGLFNGRSPGIDKVSAQTASQVRAFDNSKIRKAIDFKFKPLDESIKAVCAALAKTTD